MKLSTEDRNTAVMLASQASLGSVSSTLRANGRTLAGPDLTELLERAVRREAVEIELDVLAYEQGRRDASGARVKNRNSVRFRDGLLMRLGNSAVGRPFLRDHKQGDVTARGGTIVASKTSKVTEDGHYEIRQTVRLTEPSAVERALRGLMSTVSVGWNPTGPVNCTACGTEVLTKCFHFPGDTAKDANGAEVDVEWEFTAAELVETSEVSVPGVPSAAIEGFRAALALGKNPGARAPTKDQMQQKLASILALAATASDDEITRAVESQRERLSIVESQRTDLAKENAQLKAKIAVQEEAESSRALTAFVEQGVADGKFAPASKLEAQMRNYFALDRKGAEEMLSGLPRTTPVGAARQSASAPAADAKGDDSKIVDELRDGGANPAAALHYAAAFGCKDPKSAISAALSAGKEA